MNEKCLCCNGENYLETYRINEFNGFCHSSKSIHLCDDCIYKNTKQTKAGEFLILDDKLYHSNGWGAFEMVRSKNHLDRIFNKDYYDLLDYV